MTNRIPLARPAIGDAERAAADRTLASGRLVLGPENERFESGLAERCGCAHAVAVSSGTAALEVALWAAGIGADDEVVLPAFGFPAAVNAIRRLGGRAVVVDNDRATWNIDLEAAAAAITPKTVLILSIDQLGLVTEASTLEELAAGHDLRVLSDAACSLGGRDGAGTPSGATGMAATFSFHPRKVLVTGEGGAIVTNDNDFAVACRQLRNHGQSTSGTFHRSGTNARLAEVAAAIGSVQLERLEAMVSERGMLAEGYFERLSKVHDQKRISWQTVAAGAVHTYQTFAVLLAEGTDRAQVIEKMNHHDIECGPATYAVHRLPALGSEARTELPVADALHERSLALPLYIGMRSGELDRVASCLERVLA